MVKQYGHNYFSKVFKNNNIPTIFANFHSLIYTLRTSNVCWKNDLKIKECNEKEKHHHLYRRL